MDTFADRFTRQWPAALGSPYGPYRGVVVSIHDGDSGSFLLDLGFNVRVEVDLRTFGINTPELTTGTAASKAAGRAARDFVRSLLPEGTPVRVTTLVATSGEQTRTFVRYVASIEFVSGIGATDLAGVVVAAGMGVWCDRNLKPLAGPPPPIERWIPRA